MILFFLEGKTISTILKEKKIVKNNNNDNKFTTFYTEIHKFL